MFELPNLALAQESAVDFSHSSGSADGPTLILLIFGFVVGMTFLIFLGMGFVAIVRAITQKQARRDVQYDAAYEPMTDSLAQDHSKSRFSFGKGVAFGCAAMLVFSCILATAVGYWSLSPRRMESATLTTHAPRSARLVVPKAPKEIQIDPELNPYAPAENSKLVDESHPKNSAIPAPKVPQTVTTTITSKKDNSNYSSHARLEFKINPTRNNVSEYSNTPAAAAAEHVQARSYDLRNDSMPFAAMIVGFAFFIGIFFLVIFFLRQSGQSRQTERKSPLGVILFLGAGSILAVILLSLMFFRSMEMQEMIVLEDRMQKVQKLAAANQQKQFMETVNEAKPTDTVTENEKNPKEQPIKFWMKEALKKDSKEPYRNASNDLIIRSGQFTTPTEAKRDCLQKFEVWLLQKYQDRYPDAKSLFRSGFVRSFAQSNYEDYTTSEVKSLGDDLEAKLYRNYRKVRIYDDEQIVENLYQVYKTKESENRAYFLGIGLVTVMMVLGGASFFLRRVSVDADRPQSIDV